MRTSPATGRGGCPTRQAVDASLRTLTALDDAGVATAAGRVLERLDDAGLRAP